MKPTLFIFESRFGELPIHSYGALVGLGLVVGLLVSLWRGQREGLSRAAVLDLVFYAIVTGLVGSRLFYVVLHSQEYLGLCIGTGVPRSFSTMLADCTAPLRFWQGGLVFLGGAILAAITTLLIARRQQLKLGAVADALAPGVAIAHVFGRLGCFMVGCCYGKPFASGVHFPKGSVAYMELQNRGLLPPSASTTMGLHPTQLYESLGELCLFILLLIFGTRRPFSGAIALAYGIGYGILRISLEFFRDDELQSTRIPSSAQIMSLLLVVICVIAFVYLNRRSQRMRTKEILPK
jgi:phosphatidylglycerol:prolipoprotein diacylglycerol transferase